MTAVKPATGRAAGTLVLDGAARSFGPTRAVVDMSLAVSPGEVVGVIGPNGAGKSTLMRIIAGEIRPDAGRLAIGGVPVDLDAYSPRVAHGHGVRTVHQELSLCGNLTVFENFLIEYGRRTATAWRATMKAHAARALAQAFPGSGIAPGAEVARLSLAARQMVEIARAVSSPDLRVLILDEPTSALPADRVEQLRALLGVLRERGVAIILITHRLTEVLQLTDAVVVMRGGSAVWRGPTAEVTRDRLVAIMSGADALPAAAPAGTVSAGATPTSGTDRLLDVTRLTRGLLHDVDLHVDKGELVGVYGLEGSGQRDLLHAVFRSRSSGRRGAVRLAGSTALVSGDRRQEGLFPLWTIAGNLTLSALGRLSRAGIIDGARERGFVARWLSRLAVQATGADAPITALSGGNQQKVVIARALGTEADLVLLDDPTRGVDPATKAEVHQLLRESAAQGRGALWYSTEEHELLGTDRVYVMSAGRVVAELSGPRLTAEALVTAAFHGQRGADEPAARGPRLPRIPRVLSGRWLLPVVAAALIFGWLGALNGNVLTPSGVSLVVGAAVPLVLAALGQMFVVAAGDIDLGIGAFLGLVNVIAVTWLVDNPVVGGLALVCCPVAYALLGALVHVRRLPAIVATLGASFVWLGLGLTLLPTVGGEAPSWLLTGYDLDYVEPAVLVVAAGALGYWTMMRTRYGVLLRGFGNNPTALATAGWSTLAVRMLAFGAAGLLGVLAGLALTAVTTSGDANAAQSYTLLSVTAVIIGGSEFSGGIVVPAGVVAGALTLSFVGVLLSLLGVDPNYTAAVEGLVLIVVLASRGLSRRAWSR